MTLERWRPRWGIAPFRPIRDLEDMERRLDNALFGRPFVSRFWHRAPFEEEWMPVVEMLDKGDKFIVKAEVPGMKKEDIDISVNDNNVTIKGERKMEKETKEENYYCCERSYGTFLRSISLPSNIDTGKVSASLDGGVLEIEMPKVAVTKAKKVSVTPKKAIEGKKKTAKRTAPRTDKKTEEE